MTTTQPSNLPFVSDAKPLSLEVGNSRLTEAACYAVLRRMMPVLRHDVAGAMQPVRMLMLVLERRVHAPEPDMQAISKSVVSASALTKQGTADCMNALEWLDSSQDTLVSLRSSVDEAVKLLAIELSAHAMALVNGIADDKANASQGFCRTVFVGALLAFCDQCTGGGTLHVSFEAGNDRHAASQLLLQLHSGDVSNVSQFQDVVHKDRLIDWLDIQAMARPFGVAVTRGEGWMRLELPKN